VKFIKYKLTNVSSLLKLLLHVNGYSSLPSVEVEDISNISAMNNTLKHDEQHRIYAYKVSLLIKIC